MEVFLIKKGNEFLINAECGFFADNYERAKLYPSEGSAKIDISKMSRNNHASKLIGAKIIRGSFEPIEGYDAFNSVIAIGRWKKLYSILIKNFTPSELMLLSGIKNCFEASKHPIYEKISKLSEGFKYWDREGKIHGQGAYECLEMLKKMSFVAMSAKFKLNKIKND